MVSRKKKFEAVGPNYLEKEKKKKEKKRDKDKNKIKSTPYAINAMESTTVAQKYQKKPPKSVFAVKLQPNAAVMTRLR